MFGILKTIVFILQTPFASAFFKMDRMDIFSNKFNQTLGDSNAKPDEPTGEFIGEIIGVAMLTFLAILFFYGIHVAIIYCYGRMTDSNRFPYDDITHMTLPEWSDLRSRYYGRYRAYGSLDV